MNKKLSTAKNYTAQSRHFQSGLSLTELMISMVVGLFLLAGVVTNFISTKNTDVKRDALSEMDTGASAAFSVLRPAIAHAGYPSIENIRLEKPFYTESDGRIDDPPNCRNSSDTIVWIGTVDKPTKDSTNGDQITVVSLADNPCLRNPNGHCIGDDNPNINPLALVYTDCTGGGARRDARTVSCSTDPDRGMRDPTQAKIYNTFTLSGRTLSCQGSRSRPQPIVDNVEAIQYLYGVSNETGDSYYRTATQVEADDQWGMVSSVQIGLLMRSSRQYVLDAPSSKTNYFLLNSEVTIDRDDLRRLFKVYTTTINLENVHKGALL